MNHPGWTFAFWGVILLLIVLYFMVQLITALIVGVFYYLLAVLMTAYDGLLTLISQPIAGCIYTLIALVLLSVLGLPLRLYRPLNVWWKRRWWMPIAMGAFAFILMAFSWLPALRWSMTDPELGIPVETFHPVLAFGGWLLTLFSVLHFYPPESSTLLARKLRKGT